MAQETTFSTPMMQQFARIKSEYPDSLLFFRLGDFYELFMDDALVGSRILGITLTRRPRGKDGDIPMAGVPYHAAQSYISKLVEAGYRVAVAEQITEPDSKGIVERAVVRVITPGTLLAGEIDDSHGLSRHLCTLKREKSTLVLVVADVATGSIVATQSPEGSDPLIFLGSELQRYCPSECILPASEYADPALLQLLSQFSGLSTRVYSDWNISLPKAESMLKKLWGMQTLASLGLDQLPLVTQSVAALVQYINQTVFTSAEVLQPVQLYNSSDFLQSDVHTVRNLELFAPLRGTQSSETLFGVLNKTKTSAGSRCLRNWLSRPLANKNQIEDRLEVIAWLFEHSDTCIALSAALSEVFDLERLLTKIEYKLGVLADIWSSKITLDTYIMIAKILADPKLQKKLPQQLTTILLACQDKKVSQILKYIEKTIDVSVDTTGLYAHKNFFIKNGVSTKLDEVRKVVDSHKEWLSEYEAKLRKSTGIPTLKVQSNTAFGFFIEVSKAQAKNMPAEFVRKQTLVNAERFTTSELMGFETEIIHAQESCEKLELEAIHDVNREFLKFSDPLREVAQRVSELDVLCSWALLARERNYTRPTFCDKKNLQLKASRHPVLEVLVKQATGKPFVPNDVTFKQGEPHIHLLTGPNMAGKSVYMRQVALIAWMAHCGCFVPAESATLPVIDKLFVRSGAADSIATGLSTFMVEMVETAHLLRQVSSDSLVVLDEIGRGTSTYDGISIAWAVVEYLALTEGKQAKTICATHYHELQDLAVTHPKHIATWQMVVAPSAKGPVFIHKVAPGAVRDSHGIAVARLAGVPEAVLVRAEELLAGWDSGQRESNPLLAAPSLPQVKIKESSDTLKTWADSLNLEEISPKQALDLLFTLKKELQ